MAGAMAGPISRGDAEVVALHMREIMAVDPCHLGLYREVSLRLLRLAREQGRLDDASLARLETTIHGGG